MKMKGKSTFTKQEAEKIILLIRQKLEADSSAQKGIRNKIRKLKFYASDFGIGGGYTEHDFLSVVKISDDNSIPISSEEIDDTKDNLQEANEVPTFKVESLSPIVNINSKILILGTMPGIESLRKQEYYGHSRNLLWKMIAHITGNEIPEQYKEKVKLLNAEGIALWDVCMTCIREGSLDSNIQDETPNDLHTLIDKYPTIKAIAFNGKEAAKLFGKHIGSMEGIRLISLPSTSPANASIPMKTKIEAWVQLKDFL